MEANWSGNLFVVRFALGAAVVKLLERIDLKGGPVYHAEDITTGQQDYIGEEWLEVWEPTSEQEGCE